MVQNGTRKYGDERISSAVLQPVVRGEPQLGQDKTIGFPKFLASMADPMATTTKYFGHHTSSNFILGYARLAHVLAKYSIMESLCVVSYIEQSNLLVPMNRKRLQ